MLGHSTRLPLSTWDRETLRAVALAYRQQRRLGAREPWAVEAAARAYLERHPTVLEQEATHAVIQMIAAVARDHPAWLWKGVGAVRRHS